MRAFIEASDELRVQCQDIGLEEGERVIGLRLDVDADHRKPGPVIAFRRAAGAAEQVQKFRLARVRRA